MALSRALPTEVKAALDRAVAANPNAAAPRLALVAHYRRISDKQAALDAGARGAGGRFRTSRGSLELHGAAQLAAGETNQALRDVHAPDAAQPGKARRAAACRKRYSAPRRTTPRRSMRSARRLPFNRTTPRLWRCSATPYLLAGNPADADRRGAPAAARAAEGAHRLRARGRAARRAEEYWREAPRAVARGDLSEAYGRACAAPYTSLGAAGTRRGERVRRPLDQGASEGRGLPRAGRPAAPGDQGHAGATAAYRAALEIDPENVVVLNNLAWLLNERAARSARARRARLSARPAERQCRRYAGGARAEAG